MKPFNRYGLVLALCAPFFTTSAEAFVQVVGNGKAAECFRAAKAGLNLADSIGVCDAALDENELSVHDRAGTLVNRGVLKSAAGRTDEALSDYNASLEMMPSLGDAYIDRGSALITLKRNDAALADINRGMGLEVSYPYVGYYDRAVAEELMGKFQESYQDFKHVLELEPGFQPASDQLKNFIVEKKSGSS